MSLQAGPAGTREAPGAWVRASIGAREMPPGYDDVRAEASMDPSNRTDESPEGQAGSGLESTQRLLELARAGDTLAADRIFERYLAPMRRWATGRLPRRSRGLLDTDDLVQETLLHTLRRLDDFDARGAGALGGYLRQAVLNRIRDQFRRAAARPETTTIDGKPQEDPAASALDEVIGRETAERYEAALSRLRPEEREAVFVRIELDLGYADAAVALGKPSADAARMAISRALVRLAREMSRDD